MSYKVTDDGFLVAAGPKSDDGLVEMAQKLKKLLQDVEIQTKYEL